MLSMAGIIIVSCYKTAAPLPACYSHLFLLGSFSVPGSSGSLSSGCSCAVEAFLAAFPTHLHQTNIDGFGFISDYTKT